MLCRYEIGYDAWFVFAALLPSPTNSTRRLAGVEFTRLLVRFRGLQSLSLSVQEEGLGGLMSLVGDTSPRQTRVQHDQRNRTQAQDPVGNRDLAWGGGPM